MGISLRSDCRLISKGTVNRVVAALVLDRTDLAKLQAALRPTHGEPELAELHAFMSIDALEAGLERCHYDVLVIEPMDSTGRPTLETVRSIRERFPRISVLGHVVMRPGMSAHVLGFARSGVHELVVSGVDDSATVLRNTLQRAAKRCLSEEVFEEVQHSLPSDAAALVQYCLEHASEAPNIDAISRGLGVHRRTLVNRMQSAMLPPPSELWAWSRVLLAARYLEIPGRSVEWVAHTVGYPSANALRNSLKKYTRLVPSELREDGGFARATRAFRAALLSASRSTPAVQVTESVATGLPRRRRASLAEADVVRSAVSRAI